MEATEPVDTSSNAASTAGAAPTDAAAAATAISATEIATITDDGQLAVEVDVQCMQLTLKASHPQALHDNVAKMPDVIDIFGQVSMQACLTEQTAARACYRVVGRCHDIEFWPNADDKLPQLDHFRAYYPEELYPSEKVWLPAVLENIKRAYLTFPKPLEIYLPEEPVPEDAQVASPNPPHAHRPNLDRRSGCSHHLHPFVTRKLTRRHSPARRSPIWWASSPSRAVCGSRFSSTARVAWCTSTALSRTVDATTARSSTARMRASACAACSRRTSTACTRGPGGGGTRRATPTP